MIYHFIIFFQTWSVLRYSIFHLRYWILQKYFWNLFEIFHSIKFCAFTRTVHLYGGLWLFEYVLILFKKLYMFLLILIIKKDHVYHPSKELQLYFQKNTWSFLNTSNRSVSDSSFLTKLGNGIWIPLKLIVRSLSLQGVKKQRKNCQYLTIFQKFSSLLLETRKNKLNSRLYRPDNTLLLKL